MRSSRMLLALAVLLVAAGLPSYAQAQSSQDSLSRPQAGMNSGQASEQAGPPALAPNAVPTGTRFLIGLVNTLSTKDDKPGMRFRCKTLEPIAAADGSVVPAGSTVWGHVDKVQPAGKAGRARLWLTFDSIETRQGRMPLVADISDTPGTHSIRVAFDREGEIEARIDNRTREAEAAAGGAAVGAAPGVMAHNAKDAAIGGAVGAASAFMLASGLGQELTLQKDTKLELVLERPLFLGRT
jgi:hypothetical protein